MFVEDLSKPTARIEDAEAHHLLHVLRLGVGDAIELFDGTGRIAQARIQAVSRRHADAEVVACQFVPEPEQPAVTVAAAPPKGDRLKWMVEKLTEIGVDELILLHTERTVVTPGETRLDKLRAVVVGGCKQCGRARLMRLQPMTRLSALLEQNAARSTPAQLFLAHPEPKDETAASEPQANVPDDTPLRAADPRLLLIGPEGGFTDAEVELVQQRQPRLIHWPDTILRIETAAVVFSTLLLNQIR